MYIFQGVCNKTCVLCATCLQGLAQLNEGLELGEDPEALYEVTVSRGGVAVRGVGLLHQDAAARMLLANMMWAGEAEDVDVELQLLQATGAYSSTPSPEPPSAFES